jgi:hypothetical protein
VLKTANAAGTNGLMCLPKQGAYFVGAIWISDKNFVPVHDIKCSVCLQY